LIEISQFKHKIKSHGLLLSLFYTAEFIARPTWRKVWVEPFLKSYSQRYEDIIIDDILGLKNTGPYLDIGAYDPHRLSNSKRFYDRGWRGCNVEPNPRRFERFVKDRPEDINLNVGVSDSAGRLIFYEVVPDAFSTLSDKRARELREQGAKFKAEIEVPVITMAELFERFLHHAEPDFCTIDTEGMDIAVLKGNDWTKFRPRVICVEVTSIQNSEAGSQEAESVEGFMSSVGYRKHSVTVEFGVPLNEIYLSEEKLFDLDEHWILMRWRVRPEIQNPLISGFLEYPSQSPAAEAEILKSKATAKA
jgi:FkbM family methyltransferase